MQNRTLINSQKIPLREKKKKRVQEQVYNRDCPVAMLTHNCFELHIPVTQAKCHFRRTFVEPGSRMPHGICIISSSSHQPYTVCVHMTLRTIDSPIQYENAVATQEGDNVRASLHDVPQERLWRSLVKPWIHSNDWCNPQSEITDGRWYLKTALLKTLLAFWQNDTCQIDGA